MGAKVGWIVLLAAATGLSACEDDRETAKISDVVVIAVAPVAATIVSHEPRLADATIATPSYAASRDAILQHEADSAASSIYPKLAPDRLDMASEPIGGDGQA